MVESAPSLDEFIAQIEVLLGQSLTQPASDAAKDFWEHWSSFNAQIAQGSLTVHLDALLLGENIPQYKRYHIWKGAGKVAILLGIASVWFVWQLGVLFTCVGIGLHLYGGCIKSNDAKKFSVDLMREATLYPSDSGYARLCAHYLAGTIRFESSVGSAHWPQFPSNSVTGRGSFVSE